ncbi:hypothetical protein [Micromonospora sp. CPCC 205546]|uniref:hypothetical protein n=1 Tax=Micromonospora sp. CPCC 205546 TaxID=3122397 RepID=UPI002FF26EF7
MGCNLIEPVHDDAGRADDEEVTPSGGSEVGADRDGLDRLAQPHLVTEDATALQECVPDSESLIAAQSDAQPSRVQPDLPSLVLESLRQVPMRRRAV